MASISSPLAPIAEFTVAYVAAACAGDAAQRMRLEQLLAACDLGERLLVSPVDTFALLFRVPEVLGDRYRIIREIGHGGMATVYLAEDPKHRRRVAVKVLDAGVSASLGDAGFLQQIELAAQLQHPHILPLFDSGQADGLRYYVMPYVEGESLRDRLDREHQLPVADPIQLVREVADALDFAHRHGVVHRDIKPENILLHDGRSMVADFGIALATQVATWEAASGRGHETGRGLLLGTPHYMSPEQAAGESVVTGQSDIYSLGIVLFEMLAGVSPYSETSPREVLSAIGRTPVPRVDQRRRSVPPHVVAVIATATEALPADRFRSGRDMAAALVNPTYRHGTDARPTRGRWKAVAVAAAVSLGAVAIAAAAMRRAPTTPGVVRVDVTPVRGQAMIPGLSGVEFAMSSDGSRFVYVGESSTGWTQLWQRSLDGLDAIPIKGSAGAMNPALSPDGELVAYTAGPGIVVLPVRGGTPVWVVTRGGAPTWGVDGTLYFIRDRIVYRLPPGGMPEEPFTTPSDGIHTFPQALPGGQGLVLTVAHGAKERGRIAVVGPGGGVVNEIAEGTMARYAAPGNLVFSRSSGTLMVAPFDPKALRMTGTPRPLLEGVKVKLGLASQFALSQTGALLYQQEASQQRDLVWVTRAGGMEPFSSEWTGSFESPALSPDGRQLAVVMRGTNSASVWIKRIGGGPSVRLPLDGQFNVKPSWTPDGRAVSVSSERTAGDPEWRIQTRRADGATTAPMSPALEIPGADPTWSPDGHWLLFRRGFIGDADIMGIRLRNRTASDSGPIPLVATRAGERNASISPDGRWLAYTSDETGRDEVYVRPFPNTNDGKWVVSTVGGIEPAWAHSGQELFYRTERREMVAVRVATRPTFSVGSSRALFGTAELVSSIFSPQYAVTPDDQRFLMIRQARGDVAGALVLVLNLIAQPRGAAPR
ncbi:MAG: LpqB family beta-propeller domain-containing protein [Gemmatimonadota bacterium]